MKTITNRVLWFALAATLLSGCSTMQKSPLYGMWQERAYGAYGMPVPPPSQSPFMTAAMPYRPSISGMLEAMAIPTSMLGISGTVSPQTQQQEKFIEQYYSLQ
ncbi:MAG: hypothetical protein R3E93_10500 [Thiothrix sp.]